MHEIVSIAYVDRDHNSTLNRDRMILDKEESYKKYREQNIFISTFSYLRDRITEWYMNSQEYMHCELCFPDTYDEASNTMDASGVFAGAGVFYKRRTFDNDAYRFIHLRVTTLEKKRIMTFCKKHATKKEKFDNVGPYISMIKPKHCQNTWWCVPFTIQALQTIGLFAEINASSFDVDDVIRFLFVHPRRKIGVSPTDIRKLSSQLGCL